MCKYFFKNKSKWSYSHFPYFLWTCPRLFPRLPAWVKFTGCLERNKIRGLKVVQKLYFFSPFFFFFVWVWSISRLLENWTHWTLEPPKLNRALNFLIRPKHLNLQTIGRFMSILVNNMQAGVFKPPPLLTRVKSGLLIMATWLVVHAWYSGRSYSYRYAG